tara:strand:+ start:334 stop:3648 length:3315 start_codon:yes stop_codon:yes gene_type:complete
MAEETKPWCFDPGTQTLGELSEAQNAYIDQFQAVHDQITQEEWTEIVDPFNLENHGLENFNTKPTLEDWFDLYEPVDCWTEPRKVIGSYNILNEIENLTKILKDQRDAVGIRFDEEGNRTAGFLNPAFNTVVDDFIAGRWKNNTIEQLRTAITIMAQDEPAVGQIESKANDFLDEAGLKLYSIPCSDITYFKQEYTEAIIKLGELELLSKLEKEKAGDESLLAGTNVSDTGSSGLGMSPAARRNLEKIRKRKEDSLKAIEKAFREQAETRIEEAFADNLAFSEQCMLLTFLPELLISNNSNGIPYVSPQDSNYPLKVDGDVFGFVNRLVVDPSQKELFELKPSVVSQLIPYIRLYKVEKDKDGVDEETPIIFDTNITNDLGGSGSSLRRQRGYGVGMNSFTFSYDGTDPFSAKKAISARLSIFASTFDDLLRERDGFKYADLALKTGGIAESKKRTLSDIEKENAEKLNFRLKATVGWNVPRETFVGFSEDIRNAMYNSYITIYLTPTIHSFDFDETGAVTFDIEYLAYIEDAMAQRSFNIFSNLAKEQLAMESIVDSLKEMGCEESGEEFKKINKVNEEFVSQTNLMAYSSLVSKLAGKDKIYYLNMTYDDVSRILQNPDDEDIVFPKPYTNSMVSQTTSDAITKAATVSTGLAGNGGNILSVAAVSQDNESIPYFYLEDMVAIAMENVEQTLRTGAQDLSSAKYFEFLRKKEIASINLSRAKKQIKNKQVELKNSLQQFQQMRVMLGPIEVYSPSRNKASIKTTLANIPISLNYFFEFMSKKVLSKEILNYPINKFIKDLVNDLIKNFLNSSDCTRVDNSQKLNINSTAITAYNRTRSRSEWKAGKPSIDDISYFLTDPKAERDGPVLLLSGKRDAPVSTPIGGMINYYVFSAGRKYPVDNYVGDRTADENVGIFHYILGRDKGIIKNISLEKTTTTGLKEVRFEQEGYNGLEQLREVYNVKVDSFLNVQTFPGTYIYVEPRGFSPNTTEDLTRYGIGGYHMITKTTHRIAPGDASTTIQAAWVASKEGKPTKAGGGGGETKKRTPESNEKINKCVVGVIDLGRLITGRDGRDLTPRERGQLGQELYEAAEEAGTHKGIYTV